VTLINGREGDHQTFLNSNWARVVNESWESGRWPNCARSQSAVLPFVAARKVGAARVDVRLEIIFDAVRLEMGFFKAHESADFQRHLAARDPGGVKAARSSRLGSFVYH
jgi:hypothetical protein